MRGRRSFRGGRRSFKRGRGRGSRGRGRGRGAGPLRQRIGFRM